MKAGRIQLLRVHQRRMLRWMLGGVWKGFLSKDTDATSDEDDVEDRDDTHTLPPGVSDEEYLVDGDNNVSDVLGLTSSTSPFSALNVLAQVTTLTSSALGAGSLPTPAVHLSSVARRNLINTEKKTMRMASFDSGLERVAFLPERVCLTASSD